MNTVDPMRLAALVDAIEDARISTRRSKRRVLQVIGEAGFGKSTLADAYVSMHPGTHLVGPDWLQPIHRERLDFAFRDSLVFVDEPVFFPNLNEFLDAPGDLVVLLMQHVGDLPLDVMLPRTLRVDLPHWAARRPDQFLM